MNIKILASIFFIGMISFGCKKGDSPETLEQYITRANLTSTVTKDPRGFYYQIINPGTGATPTIDPGLAVRHPVGESRWPHHAVSPAFTWIWFSVYRHHSCQFRTDF
jgi:hypothetical protein